MEQKNRIFCMATRLMLLGSKYTLAKCGKHPGKEIETDQHRTELENFSNMFEAK